MKLKDCLDCQESYLEHGFTRNEAHSWNHMYSFGDFRNVIYPLRFKKSAPRKQLLNNGGKA